jgi:hypothetical protein
MNDLSQKPPDPSVARSQAAANYASVVEQIEEGENNINNAAAKIDAMKDAITSQRRFIVDERARIAKLKKKRRVFSYAKYQLEQIDQES